MIIKQLSTNVFDVFVGTGWNNWSRFERKGKTINLVKGKPLSKDEYHSVCKALNHM